MVKTRSSNNEAEAEKIEETVSNQILRQIQPLADIFS